MGVEKLLMAQGQHMNEELIEAIRKVVLAIRELKVEMKEHNQIMEELNANMAALARAAQEV